MKEFFTILLIQPLANGLVLFYKILGGNMGVAIIGFSLFLRIVLNPLTKPYMKSMKRMRDLAPRLEKLKAKYKDDKKGMALAQAELYKQEKINPGAGCLPYLLQIIVLIAFFNVFTRTLSPGGDVAARFNAILYTPLKFAQEEVVNTKFLYLDITQPDCFGSGKCLPIPFSFPFPIPGPILILAALVQLISAKMMAPYVEVEKVAAKKTKGEADDIQTAMQQSTIYTFPLFTIIFGLKFSSGLALYWFLFSLYQAYQQYRTSGWGGATPWIKKLGLLKSISQKGQNGSQN